MEQTSQTIAVLSPRELAVVRLLGSGCTYESASDQLGISRHTIVSHVKNAYRKLGVRSAAAAVLRAIQLGLLDPVTVQMNRSAP